MNQKLKIRGVQLDLARQKEDHNTVFSFIDLAAKHQFNMLVLYLEGRIKTKSFSCLSDSEAYTMEEIRKIVEYATAKNLETVPVVSVLGHGEWFLDQAEFSSLAEIDAEGSGRLSERRMMFCPSNPGTFEFLSRYVREVADLFPGRYFHFGFDEFWELGWCSRCQVAGKNKKRGQLFMDYLKRFYAFCRDELQKEMMIWDDMFDFYPEMLVELPKEVILCSWNYSRKFTLPPDRKACSKDRFALFELLGLRYVFCPSLSGYFSNADTFTDYAAKYEPDGAILTVWERQNRFLADGFPAISAMGERWSGSKKTVEELHRDAFLEFIPTATPAQLAALQAFYDHSPLDISTDFRRYLGGKLSLHETEMEVSLRLIAEVLNEIPAVAGNAVLHEIISLVRERMLFFRLRKLIPQIFHGKCNESEKMACLDEIRSLRESRIRTWKKERSGILMTVHKRYDALIKIFENAESAAAKNCGFLILRTPFGISPNILFKLYFKGKDEPVVVENTCLYNPPFSNDELYSELLIGEKGEVEKVELSAWGSFNAKISCFRIIFDEESYVPDTVTLIQGSGEYLERILINDWNYGTLGRLSPVSDEEFDLHLEDAEKSIALFSLRKEISQSSGNDAE